MMRNIYRNADCVTAIGGPYPLHQSKVIFEESDYDWVFEEFEDDGNE